eukprot:XP_001694341.1 predicted protein [Chlamydomonas reinhardtii]
MITGANSGIGFQATRLLARNNAHVVMVVRDEDKGRKGVDLRTSGLPAYAASKLYLLMASRDLNRRLRGTGVDVFPVHPALAPEGGGQHPKHQPPPGSAMPLL